MLYIISGASLSGKSSLRRLVTREYGISGVDTDTLRTMTNVLRPDLKVGHNESTATNYINMMSTIKAFIYGRSFFDEDYLLEGDCIHVELIHELVSMRHTRGVVLGYANDSVHDRMKILQDAPLNHWAKTLTHKELEKKLEEFIAFSSFLKSEAKNHRVQYIDASSRTSIEILYSKIKMLFFA